MKKIILILLFCLDVRAENPGHIIKLNADKTSALIQGQNQFKKTR